MVPFLNAYPIPLLSVRLWLLQRIGSQSSTRCSGLGDRGGNRDPRQRSDLSRVRDSRNTIILLNDIPNIIGNGNFIMWAISTEFKRRTQSPIPLLPLTARIVEDSTSSRGRATKADLELDLGSSYRYENRKGANVYGCFGFAMPKKSTRWDWDKYESWSLQPCFCGGECSPSF